MMDTSDKKFITGPYTNVPKTPGSVWYGKETMNVYDSKGKLLCVVPRIYHYDRDGKIAKAISKAVADALNEVSFEFDESTMEARINKF